MASAHLLCGNKDCGRGSSPLRTWGPGWCCSGSLRQPAFTLVAEADEVMELPEEYWLPHFSRLTPAQLEQELPAVLGELPASAGGEAAPASEVILSPDAFEGAARDAGTGFARERGEQAPLADLRQVWPSRPGGCRPSTAGSW
jgi:hypothetical protein